jgi:pilus assembly protein CpaE
VLKLSRETISLFIVAEDDTLRTDLCKQLSVYDKLQIVADGDFSLFEVANESVPFADVVLVVLNKVAQEYMSKVVSIVNKFPTSAVILLGYESTPKEYRFALQAGARDYVPYSATVEVLIESIESVYRQLAARRIHGSLQQAELDRARSEAQVFTVFSTKGGVGKTTVAVNLAVAMAKCTGTRVALVDLDLQFGDVAIMLDIQPRKTLYDLVAETRATSFDLSSYMTVHKSGLEVLSAPKKPEQAEVISEECIRRVLTKLKSEYDYVVFDTCQLLEDRVLTVLDISDAILLIATLDLPTIKNAKLCLDVMRMLKYDGKKIRLVLNRFSTTIGVRPEDLEKSLDKKVDYRIPSDGPVVVSCANSGNPFVLSSPASKISESIYTLANDLTRLSSLESGSNGLLQSRLFRRLRTLLAGKEQA